MKLHTFPVGQMKANCYICIDEETQQGLIIDPGDDGSYLIDQITRLNITPIGILATHGHFDHIMAGFEIQQTYQLPFYLHKNDWFLLDRMQQSAQHFLGYDHVDPAPTHPIDISEEKDIKFGNTVFQVFHIPGHTPGSIGLFHKELQTLLVGDVVFAHGAYGRTDFAYSDAQQLIRSIQSLLLLPNETIVYPGHGETTTIGDERVFYL